LIMMSNTRSRLSVIIDVMGGENNYNIS